MQIIEKLMFISSGSSVWAGWAAARIKIFGAPY